MLDKKQVAIFKRVVRTIPGVEPKKLKVWTGQILKAIEVIGSPPTLEGVRKAVHLIGYDSSPIFMRNTATYLVVAAAEMMQEAERKDRKEVKEAMKLWRKCSFSKGDVLPLACGLPVEPPKRKAGR